MMLKLVVLVAMVITPSKKSMKWIKNDLFMNEKSISLESFTCKHYHPTYIHTNNI